MRKTDYILSYLFPLTVEQTGSTKNPVLKIILSAGKYLLNTENTNYSFGMLHTYFVKVFKKLKLNWNKIDNVLILGFGTGSVAEITANYKQECKIDGVEIDKKVIELGEKYFNTKSLKNVSIYCEDAYRYLKNCQKKYDLIVIDVYIDINIPEEIETEQFIVYIKKALNVGGLVVFSKYITSKTNTNQIPLLKELYEKTFKNIKIMSVNITGKVFIAEKLSEE